MVFISISCAAANPQHGTREAVNEHYGKAAYFIGLLWMFKKAYFLKSVILVFVKVSVQGRNFSKQRYSLPESCPSLRPASAPSSLRRDVIVVTSSPVSSAFAPNLLRSTLEMEETEGTFWRSQVPSEMRRSLISQLKL